ncbi:hypothetical protein HN992_03175 [Candidatus Woesearchaeota archaeon]|jgi:hypothetical protein|nr:hypothetical protein [Candidatus Woesearchaeota archaeon]MBT3438941.1 hypothetical protein [Candidatus Woesearchaeota archaeon]MBT4057968.1 hypothetical protein [Candidatus Woesearchaeota archaeon]MBT4206862.1 hypothetical protein [Candidatus Woesearchaeota archaeon]MBT4733347.1 hypothetical protein [Candidatus Woesearchaeota archaeon]
MARRDFIITVTLILAAAMLANNLDSDLTGMQTTTGKGPDALEGHNECFIDTSPTGQKSFSCRSVQGPGQDQCSSYADCDAQWDLCCTLTTCSPVQAGTCKGSSCTANSDCLNIKDEIIVTKDCTGRDTTGNKDACIFIGKGLVCGTSSDESKKYCCESDSSGGCSCSTEIKNPCSKQEDCLGAMCYAEAAGESAACKKAVSCVMKNRKDSDLYPDDYCALASEGADNNNQPLQFKPFRCVCQKGSNPNGNNRYCDACEGTITNSLEKKAADQCKEIADQLATNPSFCNGYSADSFYAGNSSGNCDSVCGEGKGTKVSAKGCEGHVFCKCN